MGDRANIVIRDVPPWVKHPVGRGEAVFLYGHWSGFELPETLRKALVHGRERWDDPPYLARIVFDVMVGDSQGSKTGYGISTYICDNEHDLLVLLPSTQTLVRLPERDYLENGFDGLDEHPSISFADYVFADERTWDNLTDSVCEAA